MTWFIETINRVGGFEKENCSLVWKGLRPLSLMTRSWWYLFVDGAGSLSASCHHVVTVIMTHPCHDGSWSWAGRALRDWCWRWRLSSWHYPDTQSQSHTAQFLSSSPEPAPSQTEHWVLVSSNIPRLGLGPSGTARPHVQRGAIVIWSGVPCAIISGHWYIAWYTS